MPGNRQLAQAQGVHPDQQMSELTSKWTNE